MYSRSHLVISGALGVGIAAVAGSTPVEGVILVGFAAGLGTAIDLDHFVIARLRSGDWRHLRLAFSDPSVALIHQEQLFDEGDIGPMTRLLSHMLIAGVLVGGLLVLEPFLAIVAAIVVYSHVVCDLIASVRKYEL